MHRGTKPGGVCVDSAGERVGLPRRHALRPSMHSGGVRVSANPRHPPPCRLAPPGSFKLADFGLARIYGSPDGRLTNQVGLLSRLAGASGGIRVEAGTATHRLGGPTASRPAV